MSEHDAKVSPPPRRWMAVEIPAAYLLSVVLTVAFFQLARINGFFQQYLHTLVGAMFVAIPMLVLLPRHESFDDYGLPPKPWAREALWALTIAAIVFPPFWGGFQLWHGWLLRGSWLSFHLVLPAGFWNAALANLVVVALPEELFYRGYLMGRLDLLLEGTLARRRHRAAVTVLVTAIAFAIGHYVVTFDPQRLAVFFPALVFGWMRYRRRSITASVVFHALCNIYMDFLLLGHGLVRPQEYLQ